MSTILMVMSAAATWERTDGTSYPTGYWAEELAAPHEQFVAAGYAVDFAAPGGVRQPLDAHSADPDVAGPECGRYVAYAARTLDEFGAPLSLDEIDADDYVAVVLPGGHGPVVDLFEDRDLGRILRQTDDAGRPIGALCHGPAGLLSAVDTDGSWRFAGRSMTAFTDEEERLFGTAEAAPWLLASRLGELGAHLEQGEPYQAFTVVDGHLVTGQNPASSVGLAQGVVGLLHAKPEH